MIGVIAQGRMGNQLFQYAFAYVTARKLQTDFFIYLADSLHYFDLIDDFDRINEKNIKHYSRKNILRFSDLPFVFKEFKNPIKYVAKRKIHKNICTWNNTLDENNYLLKEISDNTLYSGFFQSEEYLTEFRTEIMKMFAIKNEFRSEFEKNKKYLLGKKYIAVHIRRTDYKNYGGEELGGLDMTLPLSYYRNCLSLISDVDQYNVVFVSDDPEFARAEFGERENHYFESNDEITDFQLLLNADKTIIANSSFSWWAAWLNTKPEKAIYAPEYYLGFRVNKYYPAGIKVKDWNWIKTS